MHETLKKHVKFFIKVALPFLFALIILWWMYRGFRWTEISDALSREMSWTWMLLSIPFGISAQVFRALRWHEMLDSVGEKTRITNCIHAIFISYASSLVVPRVGEVLRCGVLRKTDGTNFSHSLGTVMSERIADMLMVLVFSSLTLFLQIPVFMRFCRHTGVTLNGLLHTFTSTGYLVAVLCLLLALVGGLFFLRRINMFSRVRTVIHDLYAGAFSIFHLQHPWRFLFHSLGIWISYYLHFYLTFQCFAYTAHLGPTVAMVAFVVGCFAVLVPTPNGAGPWHFAVKTILVFYGIAPTDGAMFALVVHTLQTLLVAILGIYAAGMLSLGRLLKTQNS